MFHRLRPLRRLGLQLPNYTVARQQEQLFFDYERIDSYAYLKWVQLLGDQCTSSFIPVQRQFLLQQLMNDESIIPSKDKHLLEHSANALDAMLTSNYRNKLKIMKSLYNPLSMDRETIQMRHFNKNQLIEREQEFLTSMDSLLKDAHFYKLPDDIMLHALEEANVNERVIMSVIPSDYDLLRFWVVGMDIAPLDKRPWYTKANDRAKSMQRKNRVFLDPFQPRKYLPIMLKVAATLRRKVFGCEISRIERFKRVVIAYRHKKDTQLNIKSFKDVPCENLEFLLPNGKIKISLTDKLQIGTTFIGVSVLLYLTTVSNLIDLKVQPEVIVGVTLVAMALRSWNAYNNLRVKCLCDISQTLYFGAIATNYALLTLIADRAEDEVFKSSLLIIAALKQRNSAELNLDILDSSLPGLNGHQLKTAVESWMKLKFNVNIQFELQPALDYLITNKIVDKETSLNQSKYRLGSISKLIESSQSSPMFHPSNSLDMEGDTLNQSQRTLHGNDKFDDDLNFEWV